MLPGQHRWEQHLKCAAESRNLFADHGVATTYMAHHIATHVVPHTAESMWSGHFFPATESLTEAEVSYTLALSGYYKQSMASLRSSLELGLLSVYWNLSDDGHLVIKRWLHSRQDTPRPKEIWERLAAHEGIATFSHALDVRGRIQNLFGELSNFVHSRGRLYSNDHFEPEQPFISRRPSAGMIQLWAQTYREVVWLILALHLAKYPIGTVRGDWNDKFGIDVPMFGGLSEAEIDKAEVFLGREAFAALHQVAETDPHTLELLAWINSLPSKTEEEVEQQILEMDRTNIQHGGGFEAWEVQERRLNAAVYPDGVPERVEQRIAALREWAVENDCFESPSNLMEHVQRNDEPCA